MNSRLILMFLLVLPLSVLADEGRGRVYLDANGNGRHDAGEAGVVDVKVSNGRDIVRTDARGRYRIALEDGDTLFVIKPAGYRFPVRPDGLADYWRHHFPKGSVALRYGRIAPSDARRSDFALLASEDEPSRFDVLVTADPQVKNLEEVGFYEKTILAPARRHAGLVLGLTLGDLVNDGLDLYPALKRADATLGIPWLHAPGNHDLDFDVPDDAASLINFRRHFGPDTVAWEVPGHAFIAIDDVIYLPEASPRYIGGFRPSQFAFLENYLATLPSATRVVMAFHIPLFDDPGETFRHADRARLFALLDRFHDPLILSGHTHTQRHHFHGPESGWNGAVPLHEYNVGAACGGYWSGRADENGLPDARMEDGSPNGYAVLSFAQDGYASRYHASRGRDGLRIGVSSPGVLRQGAYPAHLVYANVYAGDAGMLVEYRIDDGPWQPMTYAVGPDPELLAINVADRQAAHLVSLDRAVEARPSQHLWAARVPTDLALGEHRIQVRAISRYEGELLGESTYRLEAWPRP